MPPGEVLPRMAYELLPQQYAAPPTTVHAWEPPMVRLCASLARAGTRTRTAPPALGGGLLPPPEAGWRAAAPRGAARRVAWRRGKAEAPPPLGGGLWPPPRGWDPVRGPGFGPRK